MLNFLSQKTKNNLFYLKNKLYNFKECVKLFFRKFYIIIP